MRVNMDIEGQPLEVARAFTAPSGISFAPAKLPNHPGFDYAYQVVVPARTGGNPATVALAWSADRDQASPTVFVDGKRLFDPLFWNANHYESKAIPGPKLRAVVEMMIAELRVLGAAKAHVSPAIQMRCATEALLARELFALTHPANDPA